VSNLYYRTVRDQVRKKTNLDPQPAVIGNGLGVIYDPYWIGSGKWFVRYLTDSGYSTPTLVRGPYTMPGLVPQDGMPCTVEYDSQGQLYIAKINFANAVVSGFNPVPVPQSSNGNGAFVTQDQLVTLRCTQAPSPALTVNLSGWKPVVNRVAYDFPGASVDLSSFVPGSADTHCAVSVFLQSDYQTPEVFASTPVPLSQDLSIDDVNETLAASSEDANIIWVYDVAYGVTQIFDTDTFLDIRQIVNVFAALFTNLTVAHIIGGSAAPGIAAGAGAGTGPTVGLSNATDLSGIVDVTTGTLPTAAAVVATITFASAYGVAPNIQLTPHNAATALLSGATMVFVTSSTTTFVINAGATGLTGATAFSWYYSVLQ